MMTEDDHTKLRKSFDQAIQRRMIAMNMNEAEHRAFFAITQQHKTHRVEAERQYRDTYRARVAEETKRLMRQDGRKARDFKPEFGTSDRFNGNRLNLQAEKNVRQRHKVTMASLREAERQDIEALYETVMKRNGISGQAKGAFNRATDRRSGGDRRRSTSSSNTQSRPQRTR